MEKQSYLILALTQALIVGVSLQVVSIIVLYFTVSGEPSGSFFQPASFMQLGICLIASVVGYLSVKAYSKTGATDLSLGKGAVIGLVAGVFTALVMNLISAIWNFGVDPSLMERFSDFMVRNTELSLSNTGMDAGQIEPILDNMEQEFANANTFGGFIKSMLISAVSLGIINVISGMITGKILSKDS